MESVSGARAGPSPTRLQMPMPDLQALSLKESLAPQQPLDDDLAIPQPCEIKPPLFTSHSAPPVLENEYEGIQEGFTFGSCPKSTEFLGTPAAEKGPFEYPDFTQHAGPSRRSSIVQPSLRRGSSSSSTVSTVTAFSSATRRPSLAPLPLPSALPSFQDSAQSRRRGSMFHFQTKPVTAPIPPSLLARRGSLPATEAIFGLPSTERRSHSRLSFSGAPPIPQSPPTLTSDHPVSPSSPPGRRTSLRLRLPTSISARRGSLPVSPSQPIFPLNTSYPQAEHTGPDRSRQSISTNSSRGSLLSHSSLSTEDVIKDDDESTDQDTGAEVETPGSSSETEAMGLFTDPWRGNVTESVKEGERIDVSRSQATNVN